MSVDAERLMSAEVSSYEKQVRLQKRSVVEKDLSVRGVRFAMYSQAMRAQW